jgi:Ala-tRNA(Pro) deacylase
MTESQDVFERLTCLLENQQADFDVLQHDPVFTSEQAADVRGTSLSSGAKALICKADQEFLMFVLPADRRLASKGVRKQLAVRSLRFASLDEVMERTGLEPGSIPPFGSLFGLPTYCDQRLADEPTINFNAGDHARSISMSYTDFQRIEQPRLGSFAK